MRDGRNAYVSDSYLDVDTARLAPPEGAQHAARVDAGRRDRRPRELRVGKRDETRERRVQALACVTQNAPRARETREKVRERVTRVSAPLGARLQERHTNT